MTVGEIEAALLDAARLEPEDDVLVFGGGPLAFGAHERIGEGWVYVVRAQVGELEELLGEAHAAGASGVAYLVGEAPVLPLPDAAVSAAVGWIAIEEEGALTGVAEELARVLRPRGRVALAEPGREHAAAVAAALEKGGFEPSPLAEMGEVVLVAARLR